MTGKLSCKKIDFLILLFIAFFPKVLSSVYEVTDPFAYSSIGIAQMSKEQGRILVYPVTPKYDTMQHHAYFISERMGITSFLSTFSLVTGLSLKTILFLPINGLALVLLSYVFARILSKSRLVALMYATFVAYEPGLNLVTYNVSYISFGWLFFMLFLIFYVKFQEPQQKLSRLIPPLLFIIFLDSYFAYYVGEGMIILFLVTMLVLTATKTKNKIFKYLSLALTMIFIGFEPMFYRYLQYASLQSIIDFTNRYVEYILGNIGFPTNSDMLRAYPGSTLSFCLDIILLIVISVPVLLYVLLHIIRHREITTMKKNGNELFLALTLAGIGGGALYLTRGLLGFSGILLLFPLLTFILIYNSVMNSRIKIAIFLIILVLSPLKFAVYWNEEKRPYGDNFYSLTAPAVSWTTHSLNRSNVVTSLRIGGQLLSELMMAQKANDVYIYIFNDPSITPFYSHNFTAIEENFLEQGYTHLVLSNKYSVQVIDGMEWKLWKPLGKNISSISGDKTFNKVYDDGQSFVYFFTMHSS